MDTDAPGSPQPPYRKFPAPAAFRYCNQGQDELPDAGRETDVEPTDAVVKADRILTLFMINTIADNASKFTPEGGKVTISAKVSDIRGNQLSDTGKGMDEGTLAHVFDRTYTGGHGFGLLNCKGIIEKYKKVSSLFARCNIQAESEPGKGSRFSFRLPNGMSPKMQMILMLSVML